MSRTRSAPPQTTERVGARIGAARFAAVTIVAAIAVWTIAGTMAAGSMAAGSTLARPMIAAGMVGGGTVELSGGSELSRPEEGEVYRLYRSVLNRPPDESGFDYWVSRRVEGISLRTVADSFLNSAEYSRRFDAISNADFVEQTYGNVLGRSGDDEGVTYWLGELAAGLPRTELVLLFSESPEHQARTGTALVPLPEYRPVVTAVTEQDVARSWRPGCPVHPDDLRAVEVDHVDFNGGHRRGTLVVHETVVDDIAAVFGRLYAARYPIEVIEPVDVHAGDDNASMAANNTSSFNCRAVTGGTRWSDHAYGMALDINPIQNPYQAGTTILPPAGVDHLDRAAYHPAMIRPGDVVQTAFADIGWRWGGDYRTIRDYHHFER